MNESKVKNMLVAEIRKRCPSAVVFRHEDKLTAGIPDISVTYGGRTLWWEVKFENDMLPDMMIEHLQKKYPLQARTVRLLALNGSPGSGFLVQTPNRMHLYAYLCEDRDLGRGWTHIEEWDDYRGVAVWLMRYDR